MYTANVDSVRHTFQASGSLWQDALVMQDIESKSLWSQISGEAIQGDLKGKKLTMFNNFFHSTFAEFKKQYPNGLMLKKEIIGDAGSHYNKYMEDSTKFGLFGRDDTFIKLGGKELVFGIRHGDKIVAVSKDYLTKNSYYAFKSGESTILLSYDTETETINAYETNYNLKNGKIIDEINKAELKKYKSVPVVTAYWFAWISFFSETELIN